MKETEKELILDHEIIGEQVIIRSALPDDAEYTYNLRQNTEKTKYVHTLSGGVSQQKKWLQSQIDSEDSYFLLVSDKNRNPLGTYGIYAIDKQNMTARLGRTLLNGNPIQNLETVYMIHEYAFYQMGVKALYTEVFEDNIAAVGGNRQMGGEVISQSYNEEFGYNNLLFEITKENYEKKRVKLKKLVERFGKRQN